MNIAGIGDSWGQYIGDKIGFGEHGAFAHLADLLGVPITNLAIAGDGSEVMMGLDHRERLEAVLPGCQFLIVSSGGDDIAGKQFLILLNEASEVNGDIAKAVAVDRLNAFLDVIMASYEDLVDLRDRLAPDCIIVTHEYDLPPASVMGQGLLMLGPWLQPGYIKCGWTSPADQSAITKGILGAFADRLREFAANTKNVCHCRTQGTLSDGDWANEIHPTGTGFQKIASVMNVSMLPWIDKISPSSSPS